jgi:hypothetical protein
MRPALFDSFHSDGTPYATEYGPYTRQAIHFCLFALQALHIYWFSLVLKVAFQMATTKTSVCDDVRNLDEKNKKKE